MIFAVETEEQSLLTFESEESAIAYCEALDVEAAVWLFWNDRGRPLEPKFIVPNKRGLFSIRNGTYRLVPASANHHASLYEALEHVLHVESAAPLNTVEEIKRYLQGV